MNGFLKENIKGQKFDLLIDTKIFPKDIVLKASYNFLDKGYFFFRYDEKKNLILEFTKKAGVKNDPREIIGEFSDEILSVYLRDKLEKENKKIRENIVSIAIANSYMNQDFVEIDTQNQEEAQNQIDFDKDIDEILKEIENDPDLKVDEDEIEKILKEIEEESSFLEENFENKNKIPEINLDINAVKDVKKKFKNK